MRKKLIIVGGGGLAKEVVCLAEECGFDVVGVLDDALDLGTRVLNVDVIGGVKDWVFHPGCSFVVAVGAPRTRGYIVGLMRSKGAPSFATLVHPSASVSSYVQLGEGSIIAAGCVLTVDISVGQHCIINLNSTVGHETAIGDFCTVAPNASLAGNVCLKDLSEVGLGANIRQGLTIGRGGVLGMGGILTKNIPENTVFVGNPAKFFSTLRANNA